LTPVARSTTLRRIVTAMALLAGLALAAVGWILWPRPYEPAYRMGDVSVADFAAAPSGELWFRGFNARGARDLLDAGANAPAEPVVGELFLPREATRARPVPAVVILHGSGGDFSGPSVRFARQLARVGIAGFAVDTFRSRRLTATTDYFARLQRAGIYTQVADAYNALKALQGHPLIRADRIGVAGYSLGGSAALISAFETVAEPLAGRGGPRFAAHIVFYSGCNIDFEDFRLDGAPWLVMLGTRDESTPSDQCRGLLSRAMAGQGIRSELKLYDGAAHAWNSPEPMRFDPEAFVTRDCQVLWQRDGDVVERGTGLSYENPLTLALAFSQCASRGYTLGRHDAANRQSVRDTLGFLDREWQGNWSARLSDEILDLGIPPGDTG
jgi:dienelactone hydrolase